jgi:hypothetical protein
LPVPDLPTPAAPRRLPGALWVLVAIAVLLAALAAWRAWSQAPHRRAAAAVAEVDLSAEALDERLLAVESAQENARRALAAQEQGLVDTRARTGLLRDEVLALTQRASLLRTACATPRRAVATASPRCAWTKCSCCSPSRSSACN